MAFCEFLLSLSTCTEDRRNVLQMLHFYKNEQVACGLLTSGTFLSLFTKTNRMLPNFRESFGQKCCAVSEASVENTVSFLLLAFVV